MYTLDFKEYEKRLKNKFIFLKCDYHKISNYSTFLFHNICRLDSAAVDPGSFTVMY